jgi:hypothetical protein
MLSAIRRAKALSVAKAMLQQTLAPLTAFGETVPRWIYEAPYVLGYLGGLTSFAITVATQDKLSAEDRGRVAVEAFHAIAGANGRIAVENTVRFASEQHDAYADGRRQADRLVRVAYGQLGSEDDPEIAQMFSNAAKGGPVLTDPSKLGSQAAALMEMKHFVGYVRSRHRSEEQLPTLISKKGEPVSEIAKIGVTMISVQFELASTPPDDALAHLWVLGYGFGVFDALDKRAKMDQYTDGLLLMTDGFQNLVSDLTHGADLLGLAINIQANETFQAGLKRGGSEIYAWLVDGKKMPLGIEVWLRARQAA